MALDPSILSQSPLFAGLGEQELSRLAFRMRTIPYRKGQILFQKEDQPNGCYAIVDGAFKVTIASTEGDESVLAILGEGDIVGEMGLIDGKPRSASVTALRTSKAALLTTGDFEQVADENPVIYRHLLKILSGRLRTSNESYAANQMLHLGGRLARVFIHLADEYGEQLPGGRILIRQHYTQQDLAQMAGSARENVNRQIGEWRRANLITKVSRYYCLEDLQALRDLIKL